MSPPAELPIPDPHPNDTRAQLGLIVHGPEFASHPLCLRLHGEGYGLLQVRNPSEVPPDTVVILLESEHLRQLSAREWRAALPDMFLVADDTNVEAADLVVGLGWPESTTRKAIRVAFQQHRLTRRNQHLSAQLAQDHGQLMQLTEIGLALSAETDIHRLLDRILADGRRIACCDAASLFLIDEREDGTRELLFKLTQNASIGFPFTERRFPLDDTSLAGYVAGHGGELNLADVYQIPPSLPYRFHQGIDEAMGYRTVSMLVLPMRTPQGQLIGALEFINRKDAPDRLLRGREAAEAHTLPFTEAETVVLRALASQAAVAIANSLLVSSLNAVFDGFVAAAVTALEDSSHEHRGHGYRVGERAVRLASALEREQALGLDLRALRDLRYACLLHDFGHAGPRKPGANPRIDAFRKRLAQERARMKKHQLEALLSGHGSLLLPDELARLDAFLWAVEKADVPSIRPEHLFHAQTDPDGLFGAALRRGDLRADARAALDLHLRRTLAFLARLDWRGALASVDGGLPLGSRMVVLADLMDLLTQAEQGIGLEPDKALALLREECGSESAWESLVRCLGVIAD